MGQGKQGMHVLRLVYNLEVYARIPVGSPIIARRFTGGLIKWPEISSTTPLIGSFLKHGQSESESKINGWNSKRATVAW